MTGFPKTRFSNFFSQDFLMFPGARHGFELNPDDRRYTGYRTRAHEQWRLAISSAPGYVVVVLSESIAMSVRAVPIYIVRTLSSLL